MGPVWSWDFFWHVWYYWNKENAQYWKPPVFGEMNEEIAVSTADRPMERSTNMDWQVQRGTMGWLFDRGFHQKILLHVPAPRGGLQGDKWEYTRRRAFNRRFLICRQDYSHTLVFSMSMIIGQSCWENMHWETSEFMADRSMQRFTNMDVKP